MLRFFRRRLKTLNRVEISKVHIEYNFYTFKKLLLKQHLFPVLKSNAYGHGIGAIASILKNFDCPYFVVDSYYEALQIWKVAPRQKVLVIGWNDPENFRYFNFRKVAVTVYDLESLEKLASLRKKINIHLKINTGLNRQGIAPEKLPEFLNFFKQHPNLQLEGVCSHFADADGKDEIFTTAQSEKFTKCLNMIQEKGFTPEFIHLANTAGALKTIDARINAYRLGIGLYGFNPLQKQDSYHARLEQLKPALRIVSTLVNTHHLQKGDKVGYNCTFEAPQEMKIGVVPVGYYECIPRSLSNTGFFKANDHYVPIVGRIHMNLTCFDMKNLELQSGAEVEVIGWEKDGPNSVEHIAKAANTIPYEILVKITESMRRQIV